MAPSATTTTVETEIAPELPLKLSAGIGNYKELAPTRYSKDAEEGKTGFHAAKVRTPF